MTALPAHYAWLAAEPGPKMIVEALKHYGVKETPGPANNPEIMLWAKETGLDTIYKDDSEQAWCGLFLAYVAKRAGKTVPQGPLWALNWKSFGEKMVTAMLGDVLVFERRDRTGKLIGGHVGLYVGDDTNAYHVLGGNTQDQVTIARILRMRCVGIRRPKYIVQPANVRRIELTAGGTLSTNEA